MRERSKRINKSVIYRVAAVAIAIAVNVILGFTGYKLKSPLYFDTLGTIAITAIGGVFPGILTAVFSNVFSLFFDANAVYFAFVNSIIAILTASFLEKYTIKDIGKVAGFISLIALISGTATALIQWFLFGGPENSSIADTVKIFTDSSAAEGFFIFLILNLLLNFIDKGLSTGIAFLIVQALPERIRSKVAESGWMQRPLSRSEINSMKDWSKGVRHSIRARTTMLIAAISLAVMLVTGLVGWAFFVGDAKNTRRSSTVNSASFAADVIDPELVDEYLVQGEGAEGYKETEEMLKKIKNNASNVERLYAVKIKEDGIYYIFDIENDGKETRQSGDRQEISEEMTPYLPELLAGQETEQIETSSISGWDLKAFHPVKNEYGTCVCYVGADASYKYLAGHLGQVMVKVILALAGFFVLVIACGMWITGFYTVYPINSIASCIEGFIEAGDDQEIMDEHVRKLRRLDVNTGDELEKMYRSICRMSSDTAEKMREIRHYAESTSQMQSGLIITMADMVENRDSDTGAHVRKTAAYVRIILEGLKKKGYYPEKLTPKYISDVEMSAPLHDVGKINIPDAVLNKPDKLTDEEYEIMKTHTTAGKHIMESAISTVHGESYLKEARNMAAYHHERWDGKGYPEQLHGEVIPLSARVMAVADVFDALSSPRVYKPAFPLEKALSIIQEGAGTQFDPKCVEVFMEALPEVKQVLKKYGQL